MDALAHACQKLLAERARQQPTPAQEVPPPPYSESDMEDDTDTEDSEPLPVKLTVNASTSIKGSNNLIPTSPTLLSDATKFSTLLLHAVNQINTATTLANSEAAQESKMRRFLKVDLTVNCGITVVGDRNVVGCVGVRPRAQQGQGHVVAGAKRKAEDEEPSCESEVKVVKKERAEGEDGK